MTDLVDYLKKQLGECSCFFYIIGRNEIGFFHIKQWNESCPRHEDDPWTEYNQEQFRLIDEGNMRDYQRQEKIYGKGNVPGFKSDKKKPKWLHWRRGS